ncbi:MAG: histidine kinase N-terminal domain-containing protein [Nitriliruptorales bacterium]|nr:histidine kinase N-terminal domain-containing protein [Nitriliruptorales bacterium]
MSSLQDLVDEHVGLPSDAVDQLQAIVSDWQILADLSFADLLMFCREPESGRLMVVAQMRPYTTQTIYYEDLVGQEYEPEERPAVVRAFESGQIIRDGDPDWSTGVPVREEAVPVPRDPHDEGAEIIAVVTREANLSMVRAPSQLELTYLQAANELSRMLAEGAFPFPGEDPERELAPRVGDGLMRLDPSGVVQYASPNAISAYRRLGVVDNIIGRNLKEFDLDDVAVMEALADGEPLESEVEARGAVVLRRLLPLTRSHEVLGGLMLIREVTELRRHERLLLYKDATIREIHHRVKNNLQTVASLLRLQSRRLGSEEAQQALTESVRRISSIALVHETLSQDSRQRVSFDKVAQRLVDMLGTGLTDPERPVHMNIDGTAGELPAEVATPLALVLSEMLQNSVEHAFPDRGGNVSVELERRSATLHLTVRDDGVGVPEGWSLENDANLGLRIASTLVESELGGTLEVTPADEGGTVCVALLPLPR